MSGPTYRLTESLFLRLLGLVYVTAFASLWPQIVGLVGSHGIMPSERILQTIHGEAGVRAYFYVPTLFWFGISDVALVTFCVLGCAAGAVLMTGYFPRWAAGVCWVLFLSLVSIGQPFTGFQWDALLLEAGFLALFAGASWLVWAGRFLLFRLMFESGAVKLLSGDPNWRNLHALRFHFMTQPLPNPLAYYCHFAPAPLLDSMTFLALTIELAAPLLLFCPKPLRHIGGALLMLLQVVILLTGNYAFFNLLTLALCSWAFDDSLFVPLEKILRRTVQPVRLPVFNGALAILMAMGAIQVLAMFVPAVERPFAGALSAIAPFEVVNPYGLFAVMTTTRPEIVIEGSNDGTQWREYSFRYKPGELHRGLPLVAPHQPRLDWQMWFAALGTYRENSWTGGLAQRLLEGEPAVLRLMNPPPFQRPPKYIRALLYDYEFATPAERSSTGAIWKRRYLGEWFSPVSLPSH